jgi:hypothetical protein
MSRHLPSDGLLTGARATLGRLAPVVVPVAVMAGAAAALAGCGSVQAPGAGNASARAGGASGAAAVAACARPALRVRLDLAAAGVAAGSYYVPLEFTNTSRRACRLAGYPSVELAAGVAGGQIGAAAATDHAVRARPVLLAPGGTAHAWLQVLDTANYPASKCHPVTAAGLRITAPGAESASSIAHPVPACQAALHGSEVLTVHPVQPGPARRGTA